MQLDWFMYHLRSTYKNRLDFPFKEAMNQQVSAFLKLIHDTQPCLLITL